MKIETKYALPSIASNLKPGYNKHTGGKKIFTLI